MMKTIGSWGRLELASHQVVDLYDSRAPLAKQIHKGLAYGNGRSYGDVCLNPGGVLWATKSLDRFISFDSKTGLLACETGVLLRDIQRLVLPHGWMLPVTPGTQLITVGGAIANDVHGKNHHIFGSFGNCVKSLRLLRTDNQDILCSPSEQVEWFRATIGGMGLTGVIAEATLKLKKVDGPWLEVENIPFNNLTDFFKLADESELNWEHTVSWIDCLNGRGRGIFMRGNHSASRISPPYTDGGIGVPFVPPVSLINKLSLKSFNWAYYHSHSMKHRSKVVHYEPFFYPLDNISNWNRIYGPNGFYQYQSVVPQNLGKEAIAEMIRAISSSGEGSFLAVLKTFGNYESIGMMSFPMPGITLALDFPNKGKKTLALMADLDQIVRDVGGRIYAAKDARMPKDLFESGYPKLDEFLKYRDPGISSSLSRRLMGS